MRNKQVIDVIDLDRFKKQCLLKAEEEDWACILDSNYQNGACDIGEYEFIAAFGADEFIESNVGKALDDLFDFKSSKNDWVFGGIGYEVKNEIYPLKSENPISVEFPDLFFFVPRTVFLIRKGDIKKCEIHSLENPDRVIEQLGHDLSPFDNGTIKKVPEFFPKMSKDSYLSKVEYIRNKIEEGQFYEMNLCQEFCAIGAEVNPYTLFQKMQELSPCTYSAFFKKRDQYLLCASPERFIRKEDRKVYAQPIKGTNKRSSNTEFDDKLKQDLHQNEKERAENVMIVDLVRNELARSCKPGSIKVDELFGIYSFKYVHQMISTVSGEMKEDASWIDPIKNGFPIGSMTGAPKLEVIKHVEQIEDSSRGLYSGTVGYITPENDFDFNVVIRSILYDKSKKLMSYQVGGAITYDSIAEKEYEECMLKAEGIRRLFE
jgi:para-aminobenzoate synthetase component 1